ncbi:hypothetical protein K474DRAFT_1714306 [Panus rudis PR-1116 ss-1]|nr:hypothetical protein K474DRAFT_1714306 [Panus rudis PR-1116 ss-1]
MPWPCIFVYGRAVFVSSIPALALFPRHGSTNSGLKSRKPRTFLPCALQTSPSLNKPVTPSPAPYPYHYLSNCLCTTPRKYIKSLSRVQKYNVGDSDDVRTFPFSDSQPVTGLQRPEVQTGHRANGTVGILCSGRTVFARAPGDFDHV